MTKHELNATATSITCSCGEWAADPDNEAATINRAYVLHVAQATAKAEVAAAAEAAKAEEAKPAPAELRELSFELVASRRGLVMVYGKLTENEERLADLDKQPPNFRPMIGTYAAVAAEANRRNEIQTRHNHLDYLYAPEPRKLAGAAA